MKTKYKYICVSSFICALLILCLGFFVQIPITSNAVLQLIEYDQFFTLRKSNNFVLEWGQNILVEYKKQHINCKIIQISNDDKFWTFQIDKYLFFDNQVLLKDINIIFKKTYLFSYLFSYII